VTFEVADTFVRAPHAASEHAAKSKLTCGSNRLRMARSVYMPGDYRQILARAIKNDEAVMK